MDAQNMVLYMKSPEVEMSLLRLISTHHWQEDFDTPAALTPWKQMTRR
jgi:hypothetical protein